MGKIKMTVNEEINQKLILLSKNYLAEREKRIRPGTDDKILTSWNALMAKGFIDAYRAFGEGTFSLQQKEILIFLLQKPLHLKKNTFQKL